MASVEPTFAYTTTSDASPLLPLKLLLLLLLLRSGMALRRYTSSLVPMTLGLIFAERHAIQP